ncbi:small hydrophobic protein [Ninomys virus]|nr:small hydrophobic protein [Ninomys virus]
MEKDVSIALFTIYFVCIFWCISSIIWFVYLMARIYSVRTELIKRINTLNNEVVYLHDIERERLIAAESNPPPYSTV